MVDLCVRSLDLDDQKRLAIGVARLGEGLAGADAGTVHELDRDGQDARLDDVRHAGARHFVGVEAHQHGARALGLAQDAQRRLSDDAELTFGATDHAQKVEPGGIQMRAAQFHHRAIHHHHGDAEEVVGRHAVFQAMRAARIHRDIARDGAGQLRGGVGGVEEILLFDRTRDRQVGAARLHPDEAVVVIGLEHLVELRDPEDHAIGRGQRPARKRCARAAWHHRHVHLVADFQHRRDLFSVGRQHRGERRALIGGERVAFIGAGLGLVRNHRIFRQDGAQAGDDLCLAGQNACIGCRHLHVGSSLTGSLDYLALAGVLP